MPTKEEDPEHGYRDDGVVNGNSSDSSQESEQKAGNDLEVDPSKNTGSAGNNDPFGDERNSEVKYRTMTWWSVEFSVCYNHSTDRMFTGKQEWVCNPGSRLRTTILY